MFNFIKKEALAQVLSCEFCEISESTFFTEHLWATASEYIMIRSSEEAMNVGKYNFFQEI